MEANSETKFRNSIWRRLSQGMKTENVARRARIFKNTLAELFSCVKLVPRKSVEEIYAISGADAHAVEANIEAALLLAQENRGDEFVSDIKALNEEKYDDKIEILAKLEDLEAMFYKQKEILDKYCKKSGKPRYVSKLTDEKVREINAMACEIWRRRQREDHSTCKIDWDWIDGKKADCDQ